MKNEMNYFSDKVYKTLYQLIVEKYHFKKLDAIDKIKR